MVAKTVVLLLWMNGYWQMVIMVIGKCYNFQIFSEVAYSAQGLQDLLCGVDEFIDSLTILPPSIWDPTTRLDPPMHTINTVQLYIDVTYITYKMYPTRQLFHYELNV